MTRSRLLSQPCLNEPVANEARRTGRNDRTVTPNAPVRASD